MSRVYRNVAAHATGTAFGLLVQFGLVLALSHWLPVTTFAAFVTATAVIGFGEMAADFGVRIWATRQFALGISGEAAFTPSVLAKMAYSALLVAALCVLPPKLLTVWQALLASLVACSQPSTDPLLWRLRGHERLDVETLLVLAWRIGNAILLAVLAAYGMALNGLLMTWLASNLLRTVATWQLPMARVSLCKMALIPLVSRTLGVMRDSFPIGLTFLLMALFQRVAILLLGQRGNVWEVAWFGAAFTLVSSAGFLATSITVSGFADLSRATDAGDWGAATRLTRRTLRWVGFVFFPSCLIGMIVAPQLVELLYPDNFAPAATAILYLLPGLYVSCLNFALKYLLSALKMNWLDMLAVALGLTVLTIGILSAPADKLLRSTALAWGSGELTILLARSWLLRRDCRVGGLALLWHLSATALLVASLACVF